MEGLKKHELANMIDQTLLKPFVTLEDMRKHCEMADQYGFKTVAINNAVVEYCSGLLKNSKTVCDAAVSFPLGQCTLETKVFETSDVIKKGAKEVDYVVNLVELKSGNWNYIEKEMNSIVQICLQNNVISKVIFENCYLTQTEKERLCEIALKVGPDFIKTSTGFGTGGATIEDVKLMKAMVGEKIKIKAAGGIRDLKTALEMIAAGASRIGTSCGTQIIDEMG
ncbi:deoxyribose-phosphate aldolase [Oribacterium asaccharolyticum ACB7]|uniref:Deoxyribose-phosphate aldolase n=1 Tax=Oribacterium asaccharolyticum ACB7 TaxID=796944 RepID=G9WWY1_9FIRM|nr:deoxyribose-phosphate aldolase [Oribacterium asaccharolyticum]EHL09314.1 deoxyribose-phosphate aldolase [Oribacterium asaccharolyticum ACB7]